MLWRSHVVRVVDGVEGVVRVVGGVVEGVVESVVEGRKWHPQTTRTLF